MELSASTLDDLLLKLYPKILEQGSLNAGATRGANRELLAATLRLSNPRARISRSESRGKPFSALGELLWYLSGDNSLEFIRRYIKAYEDDADPDGTIYGAYGPRLVKLRGRINQFDNVARVLTAKPTSRRAVVQLFDAADIAKDRIEVPCTTTLQFHGREGRLHLSVSMRSNDAYLGLPHDVFCFTMIQEMMARRLGLDLGEYYHHAGSLHIYKKHFEKAQALIDERWQRKWEMPRMPDGNPFELLPALLKAEGRLRKGDTFSAAEIFDDPYWQDIVRLLQTYFGTHWRVLERLRAEFSERGYRTYLDSRQRSRETKTKRERARTAKTGK
jgi:thymidylate synthase